ncbi:MAG TPA: ABC transporter permease [Nannocystaceae bacterium]|nr:ABC transporter permease [Nannocystaceae bacterium]
MARGDSPARPPAKPDFHGPLVELTLARLREFVRDPSALFWTFGFPILLAIALGIAFRESPPAPAKVAVDEAAAGGSELAAVLDARDDIDARALATAEGRHGLATGKLDLLVTAGGDGEDWVYHYDAMRPEAKMARLAVDDAIESASGRDDRVATRDEIEREPGGRYIDFLVPGLVGLNIMGSAIWGIGFSVVEARKRKMLKRLAATPMSRAHFLLSFMLSRLLFLALEVVALLGFGWLVFDVPVRGSLFGLAIVSLWGALALTGIAMLIAARPRSVETASGLANLFMLPMWLLGGSFFSYERFPDVSLPFIRTLPLTALNDALRKIVNEGLGLLDVLPELGWLGLWGGIGFVVALKYFRWQ